MDTVNHRREPAVYLELRAARAAEWRELRRVQRQRERQRARRRRRAAAVAALLCVIVALVFTAGLLGGLTQQDHVATASQSVTQQPIPLSPTRYNAHDRRHHRLSIGEAPLDTLPFPPNPADRAARHGEVPSLYDDGLTCSLACRPIEARTGWPLAPFHREHPLRAALNELRPASLHVGLDIQARDGQRVYAVQQGIAHILDPSGPNARIQVGDYIYWHITPKVRPGAEVTPFRTVIGTVMRGYGHLAFSEVNYAGNYVNPLRPRGTVLSPYVDHAPPQIARPSVSAGGQVIADAYDPQSFVRRTTYVTPVLAPAGMAYRLFDSSGHPVTALEWAFRGTQLLPWTARSLIYAPGAHAPGYDCFATRPVCVPHWVYRIADGLAPPLPLDMAPGRYRLTIYAWDWADNKTALDTRVTLTPRGWKPVGRFPTALLTAPGYGSRSEFEPAPGVRSYGPGEPGSLSGPIAERRP